MPHEKKLTFNGKLVALFLFQYTLLIPFMRYFSSMLLVALFSLVIIAALFARSGSALVNKKVLLAFAVFPALFILKVLTKQAELSAIVYLILFIAPPACLFLYPFRYESFLRAVADLSILSFFCIFFTPFLSRHTYMRFGSGMLPVIIGCYLDVKYLLPPREKQLGRTNIRFLADLLILAAGLAEMIAYGSRGAVLSLIIFLAIERLIIHREKVFRNAVLLGVSTFAYVNILSLLTAIERIVKRFGVYSYSITKFKMQINGGFEYAASGRGIIYRKAFERIKERPLWGNAISLDETGGEYAHNLFLQAAEDFGVIAFLVLLFFLIYVIYIIASKKTPIEEKLILAMFLSISVGRLMFSSTIWRRPEFWMLVFFMLARRINSTCNQGLEERLSP